MISCIRASGTHQPDIDGVKRLAASSLTTVLFAGITMPRVVAWQPQSSIKQNIDAALVTVGNRRVDLVQLIDEFFPFIFRFCEFALEPIDDERGSDRDKRARHACFFAIPRETAYPIADNTVATRPRILSPPESGAITPLA